MENDMKSPTKSERFEMRLDQATLDQIDQWRTQQDELPSRAEAIRRLLETGLTSKADRGPHFSDGERLIIAMLADMHPAQKTKSGLDPNFIQDVLYGGHFWAFRWEYSGLFHGHRDSDAVLTDVVNTLDMWSFIESGYAKLSKADKEQVAKEAEPFGKDPKFIGFDGNNETEHMGIARFLVEKLGRFSDLKGRDMNSHCPLLDAYRRMYRRFEPMRASLVGRELNASEIIVLLREKIHPDNRGTRD
jgi:uncharacterized protein YfbU (UPF0304 family)